MSCRVVLCRAVVCFVGLRWSQRTSYCQYIPDVTERPPVDPTSFFINYDCIYPLSQIYLTLILQVGHTLLIQKCVCCLWVGSKVCV